MGAHPKSQAAANAEKHLLKKIQGSPTSDGAHRQDYDETVRRFRDSEAQAPAALPLFINSPSPSQPPANNPVVETPDRYHKKNKGMIFITMDEYAGDDPILAAGYVLTGNTASIQRGYAKAKEFAARRTDGGRVLVSVHGGDWVENLIFDDPKVDVEGIGQPRVTGVLKFGLNGGTGKTITIATACTKMLFRGFDIININLEGGALPPSCVGLYLDIGADSTGHQADIRIENCNFYGDGMQIFANRRAYFYNCNVVSAFNANLTNNYPAVRVRFPSSIQTYKTQFVGCRIYANNPDVTDYFRKGWALDCTVKDALGTTWLNPGASIVEFDGCEFIGWTTNYGWSVWFFECKHIQGVWINSTSGSVHHRIFCSSAQGRNANTWFEGGSCYCRYLAEVSDVTNPTTTGVTNVWVRNFIHGGTNNATPALQGGTAVSAPLFGGITPSAVNVYKTQCTTGALSGWYAPGGVELAVGDAATGQFNANQTLMLTPYNDPP